MKITRALAVTAALGASLLLTVPASATEGPFKNCTEAYAAGHSNIPRGSEYYAPKLDRDGDGFGCDDHVKANDGKAKTGVYAETEGDTNLPKDETPATTPKDDKALAETGGDSNTPYIVGAGAVLLLSGGVLVLRRKRAN